MKTLHETGSSTEEVVHCPMGNCWCHDNQQYQESVTDVLAQPVDQHLLNEAQTFYGVGDNPMQRVA